MGLLVDLNSNLKPLFPETQTTSSLEIAGKREIETKNPNHGFGFGHEEGNGYFRTL